MSSSHVRTRGVLGLHSFFPSRGGRTCKVRAEASAALALEVAGVAMEGLEPRRLMTGFVDTPIELPADKSLGHRHRE